MLAYGLLYVGLTAICLALAYMGYDYQNGELLKLKTQLADASRNNLEGYKRNREMRDELVDLQGQMTLVENRMSQLEMEQAAVHEHFERMKLGQMDLQDKVSRKRPQIKIPRGPIQIEILGPTKGKPTKGEKKHGS